MKIKIFPQLRTVLSDVNFSLFSFFCAYYFSKQNVYYILYIIYIIYNIKNILSISK